jgi:nucleoid-associated protein YgaU
MYPQSSGLPFGATSRYYGLATETFVDAQGQSHAYVARRFIPSLESFTQIGTYVTVAGDRYDNVAATYLGDPTQFWQLCDANGVMDPADLNAVGTVISITLPAGIPGYPGD